MGIFSSIGNAFKSVGSSIGSAVKSVGSALGSGAVSLAKTTLSAQSKLAQLGDNVIPGLGSFASSLAQQQLGLIDQVWGGGGDTTSPNDDPTLAMYSSFDSLGGSPVAQAMNNAVPASAAVRPGLLGALSSWSGIGDGKPGVFGIGDGQPGVFGIGTGKNKAKKEAADVARAQAEAAAKGEGLEPKIVKLQGDLAAAQAEAKVEKQYAENGGAAPESSFSPIAIAGGILAALLLL